MGKKVRSAKGEMVDFDLLHIQQQLASTPVSSDVAARQDFIDRRMRRRVRRVPTPPSKIHVDEAEAPNLPGTEQLSEPQALIDEVPAEAPKTTNRSKQKARPKVEPKETEE